MTAPAPSGPNAIVAYAALDAARAANRLNMGSWAFGPADLIGLPELTDTEECGTTACLAGWGAALAGYQIDQDGYVYQDGVPVGGHVKDFAARLFGISSFEAATLFHVANAYVEDAMAEIFGPRPDYGTGCRCGWLGKGTPEHAPSALCRSLRPDADRDEPRPVGSQGTPDRWAAMVPDPHPPANCGPLQLDLPPGVACPTCGTVPQGPGGEGGSQAVTS